MRAVFPKWKGEFSGCDAVITNELSTRSALHIPLITREEINSLLVICRNYKVFKQFNIKSRSFLVMIEIYLFFSKASFLP
jgi:hypothetical protein